MIFGKRASDDLIVMPASKTFQHAFRLQAVAVHIVPGGGQMEKERMGRIER